MAACSCGSETSSFSRRLVFGSRNLLADETIVGFVFVECVDHVVAIAPGLAQWNSPADAGRVGPVRHVEPVASPSFAICR